jgi:hypothetical protein
VRAPDDWVTSINAAADTNGVDQIPTMFINGKNVDVATQTPESGYGDSAVTASWVHPVLSIPSPSTNVWYIGAFPLRACALCIIAGIIVAMIIATRRWQARGGTADSRELMVVVGVPFGIVGARLYHVITDYELYFGPGRHPPNALKIWQGGLGIWGAVASGLLGGYLVARRRRIAFPAVLDAIALAILVAKPLTGRCPTGTFPPRAAPCSRRTGSKMRPAALRLSRH